MTFLLGLFILASVFITSLLSGIVGMAGGMVLMGALTWVMPVQQAMTLHATSQFFANGSRAVIHRSHIHMKSTKYYLLGLVLSFTAFCLIIFVPHKIVVFMLLGLGPFLSLALPHGKKLNFTKPHHAFLCGILVTCFQLTAGVSGPILDMFFQKISLTRHSVVATKAFTQTISHAVKFIYFAVIVPAALDAPLPLWIYLAVIPVAISGSHLAKYVLDRLTDVQFYQATQRLLWSIGVVYLIKAVLLMQGGA